MDDRLKKLENALLAGDPMFAEASRRMNEAFRFQSARSFCAMHRCAMHRRLQRERYASAPDANAAVNAIGFGAALRGDDPKETIRAIRDAARLWVQWCLQHERQEPDCAICRGAESIAAISDQPFSERAQ